MTFIQPFCPWESTCCQIPASVYSYSSRHISTRPTPSLQCSWTLLSSTLIFGLLSWPFISNPIFKAPLHFSQETLKPDKTVASNHKNNIVSLLIARTYTSFRQKQIHNQTEAVQAPWGLCGDMLFVTWTNWLTLHLTCSSTLAVVLKLWENGLLVTFFAERLNK